jgi:dihydropteroate synthase
MKDQDTHFPLMANGRTLDLHEPVVMGILNITPDSFYDGGKYNDLDTALAQTEKMISEGACIIDIGAVSSRPGSIAPDLEEEWKRLSDILPEIRKRFPDVWLSVDTYRSEIVHRSAAEGIDIVNDISGGKLDNDLLTVVAETHLPYILMHMQGTPATMQQEPFYRNVVAEVMYWFDERISVLRKMGCNQFILDPGFGFGKTVKHNYQLLSHLDQIVAKGFPVLAGLSRKSMLTKLLNIKEEQSLNATSIANTYALVKGAKILRVHDVREAVEAIKIIHHMHVQ